MEAHLQPYKLGWLKIKHEQKVKNWCLVLFYIGKKYYDQVCCDVIPMDACHLLLGCSWKVQYDGFENTYSFNKRWCEDYIRSF
jgi:hypothetical protein